MRRQLYQRFMASSLYNKDADKQDAGLNQSGSATTPLEEASPSGADVSQDLLTVSGEILCLDQRPLPATESPVSAAPGTSSPTGRPISPLSQITPLSEDAPSLSGRYEALHEKDGQIEDHISKTQEKHTNSPIASQDIHPHTYDLGHTENRMYPDPETLQSHFKAPEIVGEDLDRNQKQELQKLHTQGVESDWDPQRQKIKDHNREVNAVAFSKDSQVKTSASASRGKMVRPWETRENQGRRSVAQEIRKLERSVDREIRELETNLRVLGEEHPSTLASIRNLASTFRNQGHWDIAEAMYERVLQGYEKILGPDHKSTLETVNDLGNLYVDQGRIKEALAMYERAQRGEEKALGSHTMITSAPALSPLENVATALDDVMVQNYRDWTLLDSGRSEGSMPLLIAARNGYERVVRMLLEAGADVYLSQFENGKSLLLATKNGHKEVVRMLLDTGADVNFRDINGRTPLSIAAMMGHEEVVRMLLDTGADVNLKDIDSETPLLLAAGRGHKEVVRMLLDIGADVNLKAIESRTPLLLAAERGHKEVVRMLLDTGADVNLKDIKSRTPLLLAAESGHKEVVRMLLEADKGDINTRSIYGQTPLWFAARNGHKEVVKVLLETGVADTNLRGGINNQTPLSFAAENGHKEVVKMLLERGVADVNTRDSYGITPLSLAAGGGHEGVVRILLDIKQYSYQLSQKIHQYVNLRDDLNLIPLSVAEKYGQKEVVKILLETGEIEEEEDDYGGSNDAEKRMTLSARDGLETYALQEHAEQNATQGEFKKKRSLPELVDEWFPQWFDSLWEPRIPPGAERIRWTCACGKRLYDDYYGLQPGAAQVIRAKLVRSTTRSPGAASLATGNRSLTGWIASYSQWASSIILTDGNANGRGTTASNELPHYAINPRVAPPQTQLNTAPKPSLFLLFCVQTGQEGKGRLLYQEDVSVWKLRNDRKFFEFLRDIYSAKRKWRSRLTLRAVSEVGNCKLHVDFSRLVSKVRKHYAACSSNDATSPCPCWPERTNDEYRYIINKPQEPFDMEKNYILHCFQHPECLVPLQTSVICHVPMKKDTQLTGMADKPNPGWGIYFEEGWHFKTIWVITLVLLLISFVFSVTWWFVMSDIQGAFGVGSYCVTVAALFLGFLAQRSF
ncbi:hypothetical protein CSUB01_08283 [Colletotrichum sublineola]|uniref:Uncharacterized protein n=1 Tax=Colletotrichum sublineola TaxID=1173701 RepID=A0A066XK45_COLSU|nr:hypothetical protein CSUB01_08283 [Colletotrichum sublineola]